MARLQTPDGEPITQDAIARAIGKDRTLVSKYFSGLRQPALPDALTIFNLCGERISPLAGKTEDEIRTLAQADRLLRGVAA